MISSNRNCSIKLASSYALKKLIESLIDDTGAWYRLKHTQEWAVLASLDEYLDEGSNCKVCLGCLEYDLVNRIFLKFIDLFAKLNEEFRSLIAKIFSSYKIPSSDCEVTLALTLVGSQKYINKKCDENIRQRFSEYLDEAGAIIDSLSLDYDLHRMTDLHDIILNNKAVSEINPVRYTKVELPQNSKTIYIDQNFVAKFSVDKIRRQVENAKINSNFSFLFSPYVVEDGIKMNPVYVEEYLKDIQGITDGVFFAFHRDILTTVREEIHELVERVLRWGTVTRAAEELKVVNANFCHTGYPLLRRGQREIRELNEEPSNFFKRVKDGEYEEKFTRLVKALFIKHAIGFGIDDLAVGSIVVENDLYCSRKIDSLCTLLDILNFYTDHGKKKIRSSYQDTQHLMHAWKADYFVTDDNNLRSRGNYVYSLFGIKTIFISSGEFMNIISTQYR